MAVVSVSHLWVCLALFVFIIPCYSLSLGLVTGGFYTGTPEAFDTNIANASCEWSQLGVSWIRMEAQWPGTTPATYQTIVQGAKAQQLKVLIVVPARYCGDDSDTAAIDSFTSAYVNTLTDLVTNVFVGPYQVDALELGNELNIYENGCGDGISRFRVSPNAFSWLLRRSYEWKTNYGRPEAIVSGGLLNTYTTESFWPPFFASGAFFQYPGSIPFDYFGIHPYNPYTIDQSCVNAGQMNCFGGWATDITNGLKTISSQLDSVTSTSGKIQFFVTEIGLQTYPPCSSPNTNCVLNQDQAATGLVAAFNAVVASGNAPNMLWYDYRDDSGEKFGLRQVWNGNSYPVKVDLWNQFAALAKGRGGNPDQCW